MRKLILPPGAFRLALAGAVMVSHVSRLDIGRLAVLLFFFLSGYWVSRIWREEFDSRRWATFYASRWLRIAPLYLLVLVAAAWLRHLPINPENVFLLGVDTTHQDPIGVSWSLDIELQFYLALPLLVLAPRWAIVPGLIALTAIGWELSLRSGINTVFMYLPAFAAGAVTAARRWAPSPRFAVASLAAFGLFTIAAAAIPFTAPFLNKKLMQPFDADLFGLVWMLPLLPYVAASLAIRSSTLDRDMGNWSYPLYLVHVPLIAICVAHCMSKWFGVGLALFLMPALFYLIDRPLDAIRRRVIAARLVKLAPAAQAAA